MARTKPGKKDEIKVGNMPIHTNRAGIMRALSITRGRLSDYRTLGMPLNDNDSYPVAACIAWYKNESTISTSGKTNQEKMASERVLIAKAEKLERDNRQADETVVPIEHVQDAYNTYTRVMADSFESLGARLANQLAGMDDPAEIQRLIFDEAREVRRLIADKFEMIDLGLDDE